MAARVKDCMAMAEAVTAVHVVVGTAAVDTVAVASADMTVDVTGVGLVEIYEAALGKVECVPFPGMSEDSARADCLRDSPRCQVLYLILSQERLRRWKQSFGGVLRPTCHGYDAAQSPRHRHDLPERLHAFDVPQWPISRTTMRPPDDVVEARGGGGYQRAFSR